MSLASGQSLAHYEVLAPLGAGAMGEVYRARDTRLDREVALKVLPEEFAHDEERLQRFEREAKALASLNHAHVAQVYGIDQEGDTCFMAMELVPGEDLAARLAHGALPLDEALDICRQIAEALEAAHEAGVIHRDLKPANVILTPDGQAKVLDFGLAKSVGPGPAAGSRDESWLSTDGGRVMGTPTYMAPEQARGKPVDKRVDVWAFGCVLFECLTGRRAFQGETTGDVLVAVIEKEPDWRLLGADTPAHVRELLARCFVKDPRMRLRDVGEARVVLETGPTAVAGAAEPPGRPRAGVALVALAAGALASAAVFFAMKPEPEPPNPLDGATFLRLTDYPGTEYDADISPAGDLVTFVSDRAGTNDVWTASFDEGVEPRNLTEGKLGLVDYDLREVGFGPRGLLWCLGGPRASLVAAPRTGGVFEPLLRLGAAGVDWTRDESRVVYHTIEPGDPVFVREVDQPEGEPILRGELGIHHHFPVWSLDEEWIFFVRGSMNLRDMALWRMRPDGSAAEQLTFRPHFVMFPTPIDDDTVLFTAQDEDGSGPWLWSFDLPSRVSRRISIGAEQYRSVAASEDGRRLVATVANPKADLWRVPIVAEGEEPAEEDDAEPVPDVPSLRALSPQFGGDRFFYQSSQGAGDGLYELRENRARKIWADEPLVFLPSISPDGGRIALVRRQGERMTLCVLNADTRDFEHIFEAPIDVRGSSAWSPDGAWIAVGGIGPEGRPGLYKFPSAGGEPERLVEGAATDPVWCPDPEVDLIVYAGPQEGALLPLRAVRSDGTDVDLPGPPLWVLVVRPQVRFTPDGRGLVHMTGGGWVPEFWLRDMTTGHSRQLTALADRGSIKRFDVTPDGRYLLFDRIRQNSDIVLIERP